MVQYLVSVTGPDRPKLTTHCSDANETLTGWLVPPFHPRYLGADTAVNGEVEGRGVMKYKSLFYSVT